MTDAQLYLAIALPSTTVIVSLAVYLAQLAALRRDVRALLSEVDASLAALNIPKPRP